MSDRTTVGEDDCDNVWRLNFTLLAIGPVTAGISLVFAPMAACLLATGALNEQAFSAAFAPNVIDAYIRWFFMISMTLMGFSIGSFCQACLSDKSPARPVRTGV